MKVYVCKFETGSIFRQRMADLVFCRWNQEPGIELRGVIGGPNYAKSDPVEFQRWRRKSVDWQFLPGALYVLADDDCLPVTQGFIQKGKKILEEHPDFAILSMHPHTIQQWNPPHYVAHIDDDVQEHVSVGGIRFCRAGCLDEWPPIEDGKPWYDRIHCDALRAAGWKVGYFNHLYMNHIGEGFSSIWPHQKFTSP